MGQLSDRDKRESVRIASTEFEPVRAMTLLAGADAHFEQFFAVAAVRLHAAYLHAAGAAVGVVDAAVGVGPSYAARFVAGLAAFVAGLAASVADAHRRHLAAYSYQSQ